MKFKESVERAALKTLLVPSLMRNKPLSVLSKEVSIPKVARLHNQYMQIYEREKNI